MRQSKLYYYLNGLSKEEVKEFRSFLDSSIFNTEKRYIRYLEIFESNVLAPEINDISREAFYNLLFPGKKYSANALRKIMTGLVNLLLDFISYKEYKTDPLTKRLFLFRSLNKKELDKYFLKILERTQWDFEKKNDRDPEFYQNIVELDKELNLYKFHHKRRSDDSHIEEMMDNLDTSFMIRKLHFACAAENHGLISGRRPGVKGIASMLENLKEKLESREPLLKIYFHIYFSLVLPDEEAHYEKLKNLLNTHASDFSQDLALKLYAYALNYCARKMNDEKRGYKSEIAELYDQLLEKELILESGRISPEHFKNIVSINCRLNAYPKVNDFIQEYGNKLSHDFNDNAVNYNRAILHFYKAEYKEANPLLNQVLKSYRDVFYGLDGRTFLCRSYLEMEEYDSFELEWSRFRNHLRRNQKISKVRKKPYEIFIKGSFHLAKILQSPNDKNLKLEKLKEKLKNEVNYNSWLIEKINREIEKLKGLVA